METNTSTLSTDLYFLIHKCLSNGPLKETHKVLVKELENSNIFPTRLDWEGNKHKRSLAELEKHYPHIGPDYLLQICMRIGSMLEKEFPSSVNSLSYSLLGAGRQSLLRNASSKDNASQLYYAARRNGMPIADSYSRKSLHNIASVLVGRELSGPTTRNLAVNPNRYMNLQLQRRTLGHLSAVYCLLFDRSGRYIVTGADDLLIKLWSVSSGRLLATFRGASSEITDIAINLENSLLAAGSLDRILRVWNLQTGAPVAVLAGHTGMITSVNFCPSSSSDLRYLISTSTDGSVSFWTYTYGMNGKADFVSKPIQYQERIRPGQAQMICSSFSPGGTFLATGCAGHHVRVYFMCGDEGPHRILETPAHTDRVDSIQWSNRSLRFISGSKDGTAHIWNFESQQWRSTQLFMSAKLSREEESEEDKKLKVTMVAWDCSDTWVVTAVSDYALKIWRADNGKLARVLTGHSNEIYVLESHPHDPHVVLSAGHDGQIYVWDIFRGISVAHFTNTIEGQGSGAVFDAKWSPDGTSIAATDSHGHILLFGFGPGHIMLKSLPLELFFHTDYRPLVRDGNHVVLDEQTQIPPHLMPPPFLVDSDGNPYPPMLQRLVPGREYCQNEQLVPTIIIGNEGGQEVVESLPLEELEHIRSLHQREMEQDEDVHNGAPRSSRNIGIRRMGSIGLSQNGNFKWSKRILVYPLKLLDIDRAKDMIESVSAWELAQYRKEMRKRPVMINTAAIVPVKNVQKIRRHKGRRAVRARYGSNSIAAAPSEREIESDESSNTTTQSEDSVHQDHDVTSSNSDDETEDTSESSGYSDWVADHGENLEPPKRCKRRQATAHNRAVSTAPPVTQRDAPKAAPVKPVAVPKVKGELPEIYKASEWLSETMPCKAPYFPQMGDEIVYFRQGHQMYIDAVKSKEVYDVNPKDLPWSKMNLKDREFVKVVGIKYEIRPPRLCCLKLAVLDNAGRLSGGMFTIKYHDMADVIDFLVLKQVYDVAMSRNWCVNDKFRCMIDEFWWAGEIIEKSAQCADFPESPFLCFEVRWDNSELERMSPWDLEPINEERVPTNKGGAVPVLPEEIQNILYHPQPEEWPHGDRTSACRRISESLEYVMALAIAEPFLVPVDFSQYPTYAYIIEYPTDLSTIKARLENNFYRRITAAQFDVRYLATNAEKFNEPHSTIVKQARIISELCLRIIKCSESMDVGVIYHQLMDSYQSTDDEVDLVQAGPSTSRSLASLITRRLEHPDDWKHEARALLEVLWSCEDSEPFRMPVDHLKHSDYYQVVDTPMDLGTVKEDLLGGNYETPYDFAKDMKLIFQNSKNYNTNKRSRIYAMTVRLSSMFEEHMNRIIYNWKTAKRRCQSTKRNIKRSQRKKLLKKECLRESATESSASEDKIPNTVAKTNGHVSDYQVSENSDSKQSSGSASSSSGNHSTYKLRVKRKVTSNTRRQRSTSENTNSEDSETINRPAVMRKTKSRVRPHVSSESEDIRTSSRRRISKRPRYTEESDSDNVTLASLQRNSQNISSNSYMAIETTVSSRGRVRRLTARAKALLRK